MKTRTILTLLDIADKSCDEMLEDHTNEKAVESYFYSQTLLTDILEWLVLAEWETFEFSRQYHLLDLWQRGIFDSCLAEAYDRQLMRSEGFTNKMLNRKWTVKTN